MSRATAKRKAGTPATKQDWGQLSPEMKALPNDAWRAFCHALVTGPGGHGKYAAAARAAGLGQESTTTNLAKLAWKIAHDVRMVAAIAAESRRYLRAGHPDAVNALFSMIANPEHKDHARAVMSLLDRADPIVSKQDISVTHRVVDPDQEALEELSALRQIGATREKLVELFGGNGLARLERLESAQHLAASNAAKVIESEVIDG